MHDVLCVHVGETHAHVPLLQLENSPMQQLLEWQRILRRAGNRGCHRSQGCACYGRQVQPSLAAGARALRWRISPEARRQSLKSKVRRDCEYCRLARDGHATTRPPAKGEGEGGPHRIGGSSHGRWLLVVGTGRPHTTTRTPC